MSPSPEPVTFTLTDRHRMSDGVREWLPVRFRRNGFCLDANECLQSVKSKRTHIIEAKDLTMGVCGAGAKSVPVELVRVRGWNRITCLRCLTVTLLKLYREGKLQ